MRVALTDVASTIPSNIRGYQSGTWSTEQEKIRGTSTKLQREHKNKIRQKGQKIKERKAKKLSTRKDGWGGETPKKPINVNGIAMHPFTFMGFLGVSPSHLSFPVLDFLFLFSLFFVVFAFRFLFLCSR